jgi:hypothetical protein
VAHEPSNLEQAVSRAVRDNLEKLQRTTAELDQAVADLVAACASSRPANVLPPMLRAQTAAAALAASLEVLARFVTGALNQPERSPAEREILRAISLPAREPAVAPPEPPIPTPMSEAAEPAVMAEPAPVAEAMFDSSAAEFVDAPAAEEPAVEEPAPMAEQAAFDVANLPPEQQELHRRANRVAKVSMQDIKMLRPEQVRLGREHKDICVRLRDDIENARKEYDRRFRAIFDHPVDYFQHWMVQILADGDREALGDYPYSSSTVRR